MTVRELRTALFNIENQDAEVVIETDINITTVTKVHLDTDGNVVLE